MPTVPFTLHNCFTEWNFSAFSISVLAVLVVLGEWYQRSVWKLKMRGRRWRKGRRPAFFLGLAAIEIAIQSPLADFTGTYFPAHVVQHLLLMVAAPLLLALGAPSTLFLQTASRPRKTRWLKILASNWFKLLTHPLVVAALYYGVMVVFFVSPLLNESMLHQDLMDSMNMLFLLSGTLFWWPMVGIDPIVHWKMAHGFRMLNILLGSALEAFLGVAILSDSRPVASMYTLGSTRTGGALLWISVELVTLGAFIPIYIQWRRDDRREAARFDAKEDRLAFRLLTDTPPPANEEPEELSLWEMEWFRRTGRVPARGIGAGAVAPTPKPPVSS